MPSWNESFHKAEAGEQNSGIYIIHSADFTSIVSTLDMLVRRLTKTDDAPIDFKEEMAKLGEREKRLLSTYLLAAAEFYQIIGYSTAGKKALGFVELLEKEYGIYVNRYDFKSN